MAEDLARTLAGSFSIRHDRDAVHGFAHSGVAVAANDEVDARASSCEFGVAVPFGNEDNGLAIRRPGRRTDR